MQIVDKKLDELRAYENNPRNNDNAVGAVAASIKEFGFKVPIVIDKDGVIIAGHTRAKAAEMLGLATVPCIVADDLTEEQIRAFRLADNKTGELAGWDFEKLEAELAELQELDMSAFGNFDDEAVFLCGKNYRRFLMSKFTHAAAPLKHLGIGQQLAFYAKELQE